MDIDFPLILMVLTVVTGLVTLADKFIFSPKRLAEEVEVKEPVWIEQSKSFFPVLLVVFVLRSFIAEPFQIPSGSMESTLVQGDFILVSKFHYGLRMPVFRNLLVANNEPKRGDVMVFFPPHDKRYFIKRVIGLPGDHVVYKGGQLIINGEEKTIEVVSAEPKHRPVKYLLEETLDTGTHESLLEANQFVASLQERQGFKISCPEEIAWRLGYIDEDDLIKLAKNHSNNQYGTYLTKLVRE